MAYTKVMAAVLSNAEIAPGCFDLKVKSAQAKEAVPGQFVEIYIEGKTLRRPISICGADKEAGVLRMVYQIRGEGTAWLATVKAGDALDILGPLGHGFTLKNAQNPVFIGGGIGTPPMLEAAKAAGGTADAILGYRNESAVILEEDFKAVCRNVTIATDDGSYGYKGFVTDVLKKRLESECDLICACGPMPMMKAITKMAEEKGISCQVSLEERMGCGIGACLTCVCKIKSGEDDFRHAQVCRYGPVVDAKEVVW